MTAEPIAKLCAPISEDAPFGSYLKADRALYRALRNRFNAAQTAYRALSETVESLGDRELQLQNREAWQALSEEAEDVLTHKSRDLEVFCWFIARPPIAARPFGSFNGYRTGRKKLDRASPHPPCGQIKSR